MVNKTNQIATLAFIGESSFSTVIANLSKIYQHVFISKFNIKKKIRGSDYKVILNL